MKMYPNDWPVRLSGAAGAMVGGAVALFVVKPLIELPVWLGPFAFVALIGVGAILGSASGPSSGISSGGGCFGRRLADPRTIRPAPDLARHRVRYDAQTFALTLDALPTVMHEFRNAKTD